jgi:type III secretion system FlhB-like substrate exporter
MTLPLLETTLTLSMDGNYRRQDRRAPGVLANGAGDTIQKLLKWAARHAPFPS